MGETATLRWNGAKGKIQHNRALVAMADKHSCVLPANSILADSRSSRIAHCVSLLQIAQGLTY
eukprot:12909723-Prorocentrum_lima.AAC.1